GRLALAMDALEAAPGDATAKNGVLAELDNLVNAQFNADYLTPFAAPVTALRQSLAAAAPGAVAGVIAQIDSEMCALATVLATAARNNFRLALFPGVATSPPTQPTVVQVDLANDTGTPRVFDLAVSGVPAGVTAAFNTPTITAPVNNFTNGCCGAPPLTLTFTNGGGGARAFDYQVTATPRDQPGAAKTVTGRLELRPDIVRVIGVKATPAFGDPGTMIAVTTKVMNSINAAGGAFLQWDMRNKSNQVVRSGSSSLSLAVGDSIVTLPDFNIDTTNLPLGPYTINIALQDSNPCCNVIPGATGTTSVLL